MYGMCFVTTNSDFCYALSTVMLYYIESRYNDTWLYFYFCFKSVLFYELHAAVKYLFSTA